jgi:ribonuclease-3
MKPRDIALLQAALAYRFQRAELLEQALTHSSQARELEALQARRRGAVGDNEQLEFLGDAVLGFVTTEELFNQFPLGRTLQAPGAPGKRKTPDRSGPGVGVGTLPQFGAGRRKSGGRNKTALLVDALEAVRSRSIDAALMLPAGCAAVHRGP